MRKASWIVIALVALTTAALAEEGQDFVEAEEVKGKLQDFDAINRNADEFLDWEEVRNQVAKIFYDSDVDGSHSLTRDEFKFSDDHWVLSDVNGNGRVEMHELIAHAAIIFGRADVDGDDKLSREEAAAARQKEKLD